ncbi:protein CrcB [Nocardia tenerifensis]|uniref:Fluoride-specific ion channel FluC n=1 Tax=Nocardia tenerifensis TaxID=228006 RepID=A0A318JS17_9NOCA|nr:CrcB family protein [Nocardia tenerifensis]PXX54739.1 protein CrcB [Nocardia tenerifensis]
MHIDPRHDLCVDSDIDIHNPDQRGELAHTHGTVLGVIAAGGALGALARDGLTLAWPTPTGGFPWAVFMINVAGSFLLGLLMVVITEIRPAHPLVRPFLGVGVLGGFTTFSTYANDIRALLHPDTIVVAVVYLLATLLAALAATTLAMKLARTAARLTQREMVR